MNSLRVPYTLPIQRHTLRIVQVAYVDIEVPRAANIAENLRLYRDRRRLCGLRAGQSVIHLTQRAACSCSKPAARDRDPWIHIPVGYFKTMHNPSTDWCYRTEPDPGINERQLQWPRGKVLGGLKLAQRPALCTRAPCRLRSLARSRQSQLGIRGRFAIFH